MDTTREADPVLSGVHDVMRPWGHQAGPWPIFTARKLMDEDSTRRANPFGAHPDGPAGFACPERRDALLRVAGDGRKGVKTQ